MRLWRSNVDDMFQMTAVNASQREIEGTFLFEQINENGPIFGYDASKRAFSAWSERGGIVLEQYDSSKPIGKCRNIIFDDTKKVAVLHIRISRNAEETWQKVLSGALSVCGFTYTRAVYDTINYPSRPYLARYDILSISLVASEAE
jgi:hypothetical protein